MTYDDIIKVLDRGDYNEGLKLVDEELKAGGTSELYRIKGQILYETNRVDEALDCLIESVALDSTNKEALVLIGNIYYIARQDVETAEKYFREVLKVDPEYYVALSNLGGIVAGREQYDEAKALFERALQVHPIHENAIYGLALIHYRKKEYLETFNLLHTIFTEDLVDTKQNPLYNQAAQLLNQSAEAYSESINHEELFNKLYEDIKPILDKGVDIVPDESIEVAARLELAEKYKRTKHVIRYKPNYKVVAHLTMHELVHLLYVAEARGVNENKLFTSNQRTKDRFFRKVKIDRKWKRIQELETKSEGFIDFLYDGLLMQIFNAPVDLFIEFYLYENFPELHPIQYLSLLKNANDSLAAVNSPEITRYVPSFIRDTNIILSATQLIQLKQLYGVSLLDRIDRKKYVNEAWVLYNEFDEIKEDKRIAEEYELVQLWAEDLKVDRFFELKEDNLADDQQLKAIEDDPFNLEGDSTEEDEQMAKFIESHKRDDLNMIVVFYITDAISHFKSKSTDRVKEITFEIAMIGRTGIDPNKEDKYSLSTVPNQSFTGWRMLAWMYTGFMEFEPNLTEQLKLDFSDEYEMAQKLGEE